MPFVVQLENVQNHYICLVCLSRCLEYVMEEIDHSRKANVMVATHNEDTVKFTLAKYVLMPTCVKNSKMVLSGDFV